MAAATAFSPREARIFSLPSLSPHFPPIALSGNSPRSWWSQRKHRYDSDPLFFSPSPPPASPFFVRKHPQNWGRVPATTNAWTARVCFATSSVRLQKPLPPPPRGAHTHCNFPLVSLSSDSNDDQRRMQQWKATLPRSSQLDSRSGFELEKILLLLCVAPRAFGG